LGEDAAMYYMRKDSRDRYDISRFRSGQEKNPALTNCSGI
jgi:hypothetical protein